MTPSAKTKEGVARPRRRRRLNEFYAADDEVSLVMAITPETAQKWLDTARGEQRNYSDEVLAAVDEYTRLMRQGRWELCGEPIILDAQGSLQDGQTRLMAVIESGVTIQSLVVVIKAEEAVRQVA